MKLCQKVIIGIPKKKNAQLVLSAVPAMARPAVADAIGISVGASAPGRISRAALSCAPWLQQSASGPAAEANTFLLPMPQIECPHPTADTAAATEAQLSEAEVPPQLAFIVHHHFSLRQ